MGFGLLFVPLVGGYLFLTRCHWTRFSVRRQSGHHLLFGSAAAGLLLLSAARILALLAEEPLRNRLPALEHWATLAPFPYIGTIGLAFLLGPATALLINWMYAESKGAMRAVRRAGNSLELLFVDSMRSDSVVELTLQSGKVYVGWILNAGVAEPERKFVEMLPLASGYRNKETHRIEFTTNYAEVLTAIANAPEFDADHGYQVVVPVAEVRSARPFDFSTYFLFQEIGEAGVSDLEATA